MANKNNVVTSFDVDTIEANKDRALSTSRDNGNLNLDPKIANPDYDPKAKKGTPESYKMISIKNSFKWFILKPNGQVSFQVADHVNLKGGESITAFAKEYTTEDNS